MLSAELRHISPNDYDNWEAFAAAKHPEPWDEIVEQLRRSMYCEYEKRWS